MTPLLALGSSILFLLAQVQPRITVRDEGAVVCRAHYIDFVGAGVAATCPAGVGTITISGGGAGAPSTAQYWVATADAGLSAERDLGLLTTGLVLNTVTGSVGVPSTYAGHTCAASNWLRVLNASGAGTCSQPLFSDLSGSATDAQVPNNVTIDLAAAATALAANPADCATSTHFAVGIDASGVAVCEAVADADVPNTITIDLSAAATALAANPADCGVATEFAVGILASGVATCEAIADADVPNTITVDLATLATTATTANAGDSATAFFSAGAIEVARGGTGSAPGADDQLLVADSTVAATWRAIGDCTGAGKAITYIAASNTFGCNTITDTNTGHVIEDEGTPLTQRANLHFAGAGVVCTDASPDTLCTIAGGGGSTPTGTGFRHVAAGVEDAASFAPVGDGDIMISGTGLIPNDWQALPIGTSGQQLRVDGAGTQPEWFTPSAGAANSVTQVVSVTSIGMYFTQAVTAAWVAAGTEINCRPHAAAVGGSVTVTPENLAVSGVHVTATAISAGVGFTLAVNNPYGLEGAFEVHCLGV